VARWRDNAGMTRNTLNFIVDLVALVVMLGLAATGFLLYWIMPPGSRGGGGLTLWGWDRHAFGDLHFWLAVALLALMVLHVALHWSWVCLTIRTWFTPAGTPIQRQRALRRNVLGVVFLAVVVAALVGFLWVAQQQVTRGEDDHLDHGGGHGGGRGGGQGLGRRGGRVMLPAPPEVIQPNRPLVRGGDAGSNSGFWNSPM